ncbi:hypothetical protein EKL30_10685 [Candidimonas sp. SYP-B2681]|uniref:phospholipase effector Tle1 domain-containing protein n=1 Tax=Candidimonas sp. SYP-B2681 TaxID=2497686 RepID=UPI000F886790|nr:DUF2235 domain-containing protein [Candidimonas sp. SYP-B2681]RTZ43329.1 hypothetical protein EKL30_10685 [Candidimonas sp. SYP-B2681]
MLRILPVMLLLCAMPFSAFAQQAGTCGPSPLGQPCSSGGMAVAAPPEPGLSLAAGNPINVATGNKYQLETDLPANPNLPGIEIVRHYNGLDGRASILGTGWTLSYDTRLHHAGGSWQIAQADGSRVHFASAQNQPVPNSHGTLRFNGKHWVWAWPNGRELWFDTSGLLVRLLAGPHLQLDIERHVQAGPLAGAIAKVSNRQSHSLSFAYRIVDGKAYLEHIDSPFGRFQYHYRAHLEERPERLQLITLIRPDGMQRHYLYEPELQAGNHNALTGIEVASADQQQKQRISRWAYDRQGRAVLASASRRLGSTEEISLQYVRPATPAQAGLTVIKNNGGQQTTFETAIKAGRHVLTRVDGPGCATCAAPGSRASYDPQGRLIEINNTLIQRDASGAIRQLEPTTDGWPGLVLRYHSNGYRASWSSSTTGTERITYKPGPLPVHRVFANGDQVDYHYDVQGRPVRLVERNARGEEETVLRWRGKLLVQVAHPNETESRQYDDDNRLVSRRVTRRSPFTDRLMAYAESFEYDSQHRLVRHHLPEGGSLNYRWGIDTRLHGVSWHDPQGRIHTVIDTVAGLAGYRYGNGLHAQTLLGRQGQAQELTLSDGARPIWTQHHDYDQQGRLQFERQSHASSTHSELWSYAYDDKARLIGAQNDAVTQNTGNATRDTYWYAWNPDGALAASRRNGVTSKPALRRDPSGLPLAIDNTTLRYGPNRRLTGVQRQGENVARYSHNAFGHRISRHSKQARTDYFYLNNKVVAESHESAERQKGNLEDFASLDGLSQIGSTSPGISRRYIYAHHVPVGIIDYTAGATSGFQLYAVHADLTGAPRLVTDASRNIRWLARYSPTGQAEHVAGDLSFDLRLPGQVFDTATGWHDNVLRTYLPQSGDYLEPDPLGPVPLNQALGYARQQPKRYVDPLGLLLFAFDGTRNAPQNLTNVWKLSQTYQDGPVFYHAGPGNPSQMDWDAVTAWQASRIVETQWQSLLTSLQEGPSPNDHIPIDIIGYSRGAALARHFANLVNQHVNQGFFSYTDRLRGLITACVDLRFMGLFDTVAQFGLAGSQNANYDLTIAPAWEWVAHAVALHEHRWLFPLTSAADTRGDNIVEAPFIGAHGDIGGGVLADASDRPDAAGDLADVALNWMLWQARAASLRFDALPAADREVTNPILHDERSPLLRYVQDGDRSIHEAGGALLYNYQDDHLQLGRSRRQQTESLIERHDNWRSVDGAEVGMVDMSGYAAWLHNELGWRAMPS